MTTICSFDCNQSALKSLIGDVKPMAPVDGTWMKVSARVFEDQVRKLAYGLMVKDYRRGETIVFTGCTDDMKMFIKTAMQSSLQRLTVRIYSPLQRLSTLCL